MTNSNFNNCAIKDGRNRATLGCTGQCYANGGCRFMLDAPEPYTVERYKAKNGNLYYTTPSHYAYFRKYDGEFIMCMKKNRTPVTDPEAIFRMKLGIVELAQGFPLNENRQRALSQPRQMQLAFELAD